VRENVEKEIREYWFKDHKAELKDFGKIQILDWKKPGTGIYRVRYVFDGYMLYISGDIGDAVFCLTWEATVHSFANTHIDYFIGKLSAYSDNRWDFDNKKAIKRLREWLKDMKECGIKYNHDTMKELFESTRECSSCSEWRNIVTLNLDFISELDPEFYEWIFNIGNEYPARLQGYLIGLKMASEQLKL
jgi:hypothetical protein